MSKIVITDKCKHCIYYMEKVRRSWTIHEKDIVLNRYCSIFPDKELRDDDKIQEWCPLPDAGYLVSTEGYHEIINMIVDLALGGLGESWTIGELIELADEKTHAPPYLEESLKSKDTE